MSTIINTDQTFVEYISTQSKACSGKQFSDLLIDFRTAGAQCSHRLSELGDPFQIIGRSSPPKQGLTGRWPRQHATVQCHSTKIGLVVMISEMNATSEVLPHRHRGLNPHCAPCDLWAVDELTRGGRDGGVRLLRQAARTAGQARDTRDTYGLCASRTW